MPRGLKPNEVAPYTLAEEARILAACDSIGGGKCNRSGATYEQLRARAMALLLRSSALRVSDLATFAKETVSWDAGEKDLADLLAYSEERRTSIPANSRSREAGA